MDAPDTLRRRRHWARAAAFVAMCGVAALLLPVSAYAVEALSERAENWILVVQFVLMALVGAVVGVLLRGLGPAAASPARRAAVWAAVGLLAAALADGLWWLLLAG
ncbi:MAG: hypothetical protein M3276_04375 [Actinomycetota bacterium]|nr:hypothetical protein [Actinomycetota bacterium]